MNNLVVLNKYLTKNPCYKANLIVEQGGWCDYKTQFYRDFQTHGAWGLMLHSVGCSQPSAEVFYNGWNKESYTNACVHGFIDANSGEVWQTLPWNYRGWHCAGSGNDTHIGVEMCESKYIKYTSGTKFEILDRTRAVADCVRTYHSAVYLFAFLCKMLKLDPVSCILSHKEGYLAGIASNHGDPEHYWKGLGMNYTMDGFRKDVKGVMEQELLEAMTEKMNKMLSDYKREMYNYIGEQIRDALQSNFGKYVESVGDIHKSWRGEVQKLLDAGVINAGTSDVKDDIKMREDLVRVLVVCERYVDKSLREFKERLVNSLKEG